MESEKKKICPKCKHEDGSGQNNIHDMNIVELMKECPKYTKLYTITHGEVLLDHVEDNCIVVITEISNGFTKYLKLDELGRLSEHGWTVLFPSESGTWDDFDITKIEINSPFVPGQVAYNEEFCSFGFVGMNGVSLKTQVYLVNKFLKEYVSK